MKTQSNIDFTVRIALSLPELREAKLLTSEVGLNNIIQHITVFEGPDAISFMKGGEFLLSGGYAFSKDPAVQVKMVKRLKEKEVAAVAIKSGRFFTTIPESIINICQEVGLPLIEMPHPMTYRPIMVAFNKEIFDKRVIGWAVEMDSMLKFEDNLDINFLCQWIEDKSEQPCVVVDTENMLYAGKRGQKYVPYIKKRLSWFHSNTVISKRLNFNLDLNGILVPSILFSVNYIKGKIYLVLVCEELISSKVNTSLGYVGAGLVAHLLEKRENFYVRKAEKLLHYFNILKEPLEVISKCSEFFGLDLSKPIRVFVAFSNIELTGDAWNHWRYKVKNGLLYQVTKSKFIGIIQDSVESIKLLKKIANSSPERLWVGVGNSYLEPGQISNSYEEAVMALKIAMANKPQTITFYEDLGILNLLSILQKSEILSCFVKKYINPILEYDKVYSSNLLTTLETYFNCGRSLQLTAKSLFIGKSTLVYRLAKIESLTDLSLKKPMDSLNLQVALLAAKLLHID